MAFNQRTRLSIDNSKSAIDQERSISISELLALIITDLPDADPEIVGELWNDSGVLTVSSGPIET